MTTTINFERAAVVQAFRPALSFQSAESAVNSGTEVGEKCRARHPPAIAQDQLRKLQNLPPTMLRLTQIVMEIETAEALDTLRTDIRRVEGSLTDKIARVETSLTARIESVESSLTAKIEHVEMSLTAKMDEQKRHADVHFESVHGDIRMLAEHLVSLTVKVDSLLR